METLPGRLRFSTTDPERVNEQLRQAYAGGFLSPPRDDPTFLYLQEADRYEDLTLGRFHFYGHGRSGVVLQDTVTVISPRSGAHHWQINGDRGTGMMVIQPHQDYRAELEYLRVDTADLSLTSLAGTARTVYGDENLQVAFDDPRPVSAGAASYWETTHAFVRQALADPDVAAVPLLRADLQRRMAVATLQTFPLTGDPQARRTTVAARQAAYTRAVEWMPAAASLPITVEDIARRVGVSTIELTRAFRHHAGTTPGAYLRRLRLAGAHQDLLDGDPTAGDTVAAIATRWGFAYPGDFARRHRAAYGENPAHTLRR